MRKLVMKRCLNKGLALSSGCLTGLFVGVLMKESIDTALIRIGGFGGEILVLPLMFLLLYLGYYIGRELSPVRQGEEDAE